MCINEFLFYRMTARAFLCFFFQIRGVAHDQAHQDATKRSEHGSPAGLMRLQDTTPELWTAAQTLRDAIGGWRMLDGCMMCSQVQSEPKLPAAHVLAQCALAKITVSDAC